MRKYLLSGAIWGSVLGVFGLLRRSKREGSRVGTALAWAGGLIALIAAIVAVRESSSETQEYYELLEAERASKKK